MAGGGRRRGTFRSAMPAAVKTHWPKPSTASKQQRAHACRGRACLAVVHCASLWLRCGFALPLLRGKQVEHSAIVGCTQRTWSSETVRLPRPAALPRPSKTEPAQTGWLQHVAIGTATGAVLTTRANRACAPGPARRSGPASVRRRRWRRARMPVSSAGSATERSRVFEYEPRMAASRVREGACVGAAWRGQDIPEQAEGGGGLLGLGRVELHVVQVLRQPGRRL